LDVAAHVDGQKQDSAVLGSLSRSAVTLGTIDTDAARDLLIRARAAVETSDKEAAGALTMEALQLIETHDKRMAAAARRQAILSGLATLGYEVRQSMAAALETDGRIIIRKPGSTDYGVEIAASSEVARLQVRLVGAEQPTTARSSQRDKDQETIWCGDFDKLRSLLKTQGGEIQVERAKEPGAKLVKTVAMHTARTETTNAGASRSGARRL
jgi:hypothetical protein